MKILFVDDEIGAVEWVTDILRELAGHFVTKVETVSDARREIRVEKWPYDLIIIDVQITPGPNESEISEDESIRAGIDLFQEFRSRFPMGKALLLTNNSWRVPAEIWSAAKYTRVADKVDVNGSRLLEAIARWDT